MGSTATSSPEVKQGSCLCKGVQFEVRGEPVHYLVCHCPHCQKASGSAFMLNIWFKDESFTLKSGKELLKVYYDPNTDTGKPLARHFCSNCGSNVYFRMSPELPRSDIYIVHGPGIEGHETWYPRKHTHADNKLPYIGNIEMRAKEKSRM